MGLFVMKGKVVENLSKPLNLFKKKSQGKCGTHYISMIWTKINKTVHNELQKEKSSVPEGAVNECTLEEDMIQLDFTQTSCIYLTNMSRGQEETKWV